MRKILAVDDDDDILDCMAMLLEFEGDVRLARSGVEALAALEDDVPDVLLLDLMMPEMSGSELLDILKELPERRPRHVIIVSASHDVERTAASYSTDFLAKPFDVEKLLEKVRAA